MEHDLLGYLLDGLDAAESRRVEEALERSPEQRTKLVALRGLLLPLEADAEQPEPPPELYLRTLRLIAHARTKEPVRRKAPPLPAGERSFSRPWFKRADLLVAACVVFLAGLMIPYGISKLRREQGVMACADNLRNHYVALKNYQDSHRGYMPGLDPDGPLNVAGAPAVKLKEAGLWRDGMQTNCPGRADGAQTPPSLADLHEWKAGSRDDSWKAKLAGCYAYPMGYWEGAGADRHVEPISKALGDDMPIMADRPARFGEGTDWRTANSPNHGFTGQNVLMQGGNVRFLPSHVLPIGPDVDQDIYRNAEGQWAPGLKKTDAALVPSEVSLPAQPQAKPFPKD